jgi:ATP-GRASP peptide maturase of grasp-with-spasm system
MICILSQSTMEGTTEEVMQWLTSWGLRCIRINGQDMNSARPIHTYLDKNGAVAKLEFDDFVFDPREVKTVWYRRWGASTGLSQQRIFHQNTGRVRHNNQVALNYATLELKTLSEFFFDLFDHAIWLSHPHTSLPNKLKVLRQAANLGLDIPETIIANNKPALREFAARRAGVITKAISEALSFTADTDMYTAYTEKFSLDRLDAYPDQLFPSLLQEQLDKDYEVRSFYLDGDFYSMVIFSQSREQTKTDFRLYQYEHPNRTVPYRLPQAIEERLHALMQRLNLETGSIDLVHTRDGRYVFLEVNPIGQLGMVSVPCNYHLEEKIALALKRRYMQACARDAAIA